MRDDPAIGEYCTFRRRLSALRAMQISKDYAALMFMYLCWIIVAPDRDACARGFTNVYADLRFVLSAGTHCPGIIIPRLSSATLSVRVRGVQLLRAFVAALSPPFVPNGSRACG